MRGTTLSPAAFSPSFSTAFSPSSPSQSSDDFQCSPSSGKRTKRSESHSSTATRYITVLISNIVMALTCLSMNRRSSLVLASSAAISAAAAAAAFSATLWARLRTPSLAAAFFASSRSSTGLLAPSFAPAFSALPGAALAAGSGCPLPGRPRPPTFSFAGCCGGVGQWFSSSSAFSSVGFCGSAKIDSASQYICLISSKDACFGKSPKSTQKRKKAEKDMWPRCFGKRRVADDGLDVRLPLLQVRPRESLEFLPRGLPTSSATAAIAASFAAASALDFSSAALAAAAAACHMAPPLEALRPLALPSWFEAALVLARWLAMEAVKVPLLPCCPVVAAAAAAAATATRSWVSSFASFGLGHQRSATSAGSGAAQSAYSRKSRSKRGRKRVVKCKTSGSNS
mmetsp:Transcript_1960/g.7454  ORF Transcript_1960/g.7454 Transcript_1960/m.7454 type:complete len:398 (-) Transcript_1960:1843-3036(-)